MAFRALLFSKGPETNAAFTTACENAGVRLEVCEDIFSAIEKGAKQPFSCVIVDWSEQPEAGFLLKRTREFAPNANALSIALVDREPTAAEMRDHQLNFLIYRPVSAPEADAVLAKACEKMPEVDVTGLPEKPRPLPQPPAQPKIVAAAPAPTPAQDLEPQPAEAVAQKDASFPESDDPALNSADEEALPSGRQFSWQSAAAVLLLLGAAYCLWNARGTLLYLARTRENRTHIFKDSVSALFYLNPSATNPTGSASADMAIDAYVSRSVGHSDPHLHLGVVSSQADLGASPIPMRPPSDFPLPAPFYQPEPAPSVSARHATIPDSLRGSSTIPPPVVVNTPPMMPVSAPAVIPVSTQQFSEPIEVSEEAARALLVHSVMPVYPPEAVAQKLKGPVILQATIGRDGAVEDLKIVRGSFLLSKAAIAAVKQWRFQPYTLNGHPAEMQTLLTINFPIS